MVETTVARAAGVWQVTVFTCGTALEEACGERWVIDWLGLVVELLEWVCSGQGRVSDAELGRDVVLQSAVARRSSSLNVV